MTPDQAEERITELLDLLSRALPFVEDAEKDPAYKRGAVAALALKIKTAIGQ